MEKIPETAADISPYATSDFQTMPLNSGMGRNTIGRKETMRMTDDQQYGDGLNSGDRRDGEYCRQIWGGCLLHTRVATQILQ